MIDTFMLSSAFFIVGGGIGVIAGGLFAGARVREYRQMLDDSMVRERGLHSMLEESDDDQNSLRAHNRRLDTQIEYLGAALVKANDASRYYGREIAEARALIFGYEATERARTSGLREYNATRHAEKLAREALKEANHNSMRATLEMVG